MPKRRNTSVLGQTPVPGDLTSQRVAPMIIDMHCHWLPPALAQTLRTRHQPPYITGEQLVLRDEVLAYSPSYEDLALRQKQAAAAGIGLQVLSLPSLFGIDALPLADAARMTAAFNTALAAQIITAPDRLAGLAALPMADIRAATDELDRAAKLGLSGFILPDAGLQSLDHAKPLYPLFARAEECGMVIFIHPGALPGHADAAKASPSDNANQRHISLAVQAQLGQAMTTLLMTDLLDHFPKLKLYVANLGGTLPFVLERMATVATTRGLDLPDAMRFDGRLAVDTASFGPHALDLAIKTLGPRNVVFGTDDPVFPTDVVIQALNTLPLMPVDRDAILHGNATRLLGR